MMKATAASHSLSSLWRLVPLLGLMVWSAADANELHPGVPLLDGEGELIMISGGRMSTMTTCGACHDTDFIADSSDHLAAGVFEEEEIPCLACHSDFEVPEQWDVALFEADGSLPSGVMDIHKPRDRNCAGCHAVVNNNLEEPLTVTPQPVDFSMTDRTGQVIAAQKVSSSGLNIAGKAELAHPFDVHADRVVNCVNCHYSLNNPVYYRQREESRPPHLDFDPRRLTNSEYLMRPLHQVAKGSSRTGLGAFESENSMRRCASCHDPDTAHQWLPYRQRHFASLACESCHVPKLFGPALQAVDWTLVNAAGHPRRQFRDVEGDPATADSLIHGFQPIMLARDNVGGERKLAPFNLVSQWYWEAGEPAERLQPDQLLAVLYPDGDLHAGVAAALDSDGDGSVADGEMMLDTDAKVAAVRTLLEASGHQEPRISAEVVPYAISHNVVNGRWANRDCRHCHDNGSVLGAAFTLSDYLPDGKLPALVEDAGVGQVGEVRPVAGGGAVFLPDTSAEGYYVLGLNSVKLVDLAGLAMFLAISLGVSGHGIGRWVANRRRPPAHRSTRRVKMYDAYERIWHWLQASAILMLLFTGLIIHKPHFFGIFSFRYVVQVHNVLGFILLINAALALFYTVASGTIKRFFPDPENFVARAFEQARFYSRGIFAGEGHPLEKTPQNRLNPLQQLTYLAILNILLPAQVVTGVLIWGMQKWPQLAAMLGGLPVLAPIHTFLAWAFAAFIVMHVYLTTTGETPLAGIQSMVTGWEDLEAHGSDSSETNKETSHV
jgi:thiosulfate reductase cytochrome b subunit